MRHEPPTSHECKPTIHLNGSSGERLLDGYRKAGQAMAKALEALTEAAPNARDYYLQGPDAFAFAAREHQVRAEALRSVLADMQALALHVSGQLDERKARRPRAVPPADVRCADCGEGGERTGHQACPFPQNHG